MSNLVGIIFGGGVSLTFFECRITQKSVVKIVVLQDVVVHGWKKMFMKGEGRQKKGEGY